MARRKIEPISKLTKKRDNYTCKLCGQVGGKLTSHHIEKFSSNIEDRGNPKNIITLCLKCHKRAHDNKFNVGLNLKIQAQLKEIMKTIQN